MSEWKIEIQTYRLANRLNKRARLHFFVWSGSMNEFEFVSFFFGVYQMCLQVWALNGIYPLHLQQMDDLYCNNPFKIDDNL